MGMMLDSNTSDDTPIVESWMGQIKESTETLDPDEIDVATETAKRLRIQTDVACHRIIHNRSGAA